MSNLNDIQQRARAQGVNPILIKETTDFAAFEPWKDGGRALALTPRRWECENRVIDIAEVSPVNGFVPSGVLNGNIFEFKLDNDDVSVIDHAYLRFEISNSTGAAVVLPPTPLWFEKYELQTSTSNTLCQVTDIESWLAVCMLPRQNFEQIATLMGTTTAYATSGVSIANGASVELFLPLLTVFNAARLHLPGLTGDLRLRFYPKMSTLNLISGTHPTFNKVSLMLHGFDEESGKRNVRTAIYQDRTREYKNIPVCKPFLDWQNFKQSVTLSPSTLASIRLNGFDGLCSGVFVVIRAAPITATNQATMIPMRHITLKDAAGNSYCGNFVKSHAMSRVIQAGLFDNNASANVNFYFIPFSSNPVYDFFVGGVHGHQTLNGNDSLEIMPNSTLVAGDYQIDLFALRPSVLRIFRGEIDKIK